MTLIQCRPFEPKMPCSPESSRMNTREVFLRLAIAINKTSTCASARTAIGGYDVLSILVVNELLVIVAGHGGKKLRKEELGLADE